jgi:RNA polymerase sigma-70 factor (ECF subfamily)
LKTSSQTLYVPLLVREQAGDAPVSQQPAPVTFAQVYDDHFAFVWRNARRLGVARDSVDDVTQEVFMVVHRRLASFDNRAPIRAWLFGILARVVSVHRRSFRRKGSRNVPYDAEEATDDLSHPGRQSSPSEAGVEDVERRILVERLLAALDEEQRTLLILSELEQWKLREIAELFHSNTSTIHSRLVAAKRAAEAIYTRLQREKKAHP